MACDPPAHAGFLRILNKQKFCGSQGREGALGREKPEAGSLSLTLMTSEMSCLGPCQQSTHPESERSVAMSGEWVAIIPAHRQACCYVHVQPYALDPLLGVTRMLEAGAGTSLMSTVLLRGCQIHATA